MVFIINAINTTDQHSTINEQRLRIWVIFNILKHGCHGPICSLTKCQVTLTRERSKSLFLQFVVFSWSTGELNPVSGYVNQYIRQLKLHVYKPVGAVDRQSHFNSQTAGLSFPTKLKISIRNWLLKVIFIHLKRNHNRIMAQNIKPIMLMLVKASSNTLFSSTCLTKKEFVCQQHLRQANRIK